jgi:DNA primase
MNNIFDLVRNNVDILDVISQYVSLKPIGYYWKGFSPFNSEKTASFTVSPSKKIFYCFSSNIGGDVIDFVSRMEKCSQLDAAKLLIEKYNINIPSDFSYKSNFINSNKNDWYFKINKLFSDWTHKNLFENDEPLNYIVGRGFSIDTIKEFKIGYCPNSLFIEDFFNICEKNGFLKGVILQSGLVIENIYKKVKKNIFTFEERIIFPIFNQLDFVCGFGGRIFKDGDERVKYINTSNKNEFSKKDILYGFSNSKKEIKNKKSVFLVEGYFDTIAMFQSGYKNVVSTMGTSCTINHINLLEKIVDKIIVVYDGDQSGQRALMRLISMCWDSSLDVDIVSLPENEDPASLLKNKTLNNILLKQESGIDFFINSSAKEFQTSTNKTKEKKIENIILCISKMKDKLKQAIIISNISKSLGFDPSFLYKQIEQKNVKTYNEKTNNISINEKNIELDADKNNWMHITICLIVFYDEKNSNISNISYLIIKYAPKEIKNLLENFISFIYNNKKSDYLEFFDTLNEVDKKECLYLLVKYNFSFEHLNVMYMEMLKKVWKAYMNNLIKKNENIPSFTKFCNNPINFLNEIDK